MSNTITELATIDYRNNISVSRDTYNDDGELIDSVVIFSTDTDSFLPDRSEFDENWTAGQYIDEFLSYQDFESEEEKQYVADALWSCRLRYLAEGMYTQWEQEQA